MTTRKRRAALLEWAAEVGANGIHEAIVSTLTRGGGEEPECSGDEAENGVKKAGKASDSAEDGCKVAGKKNARYASGHETDGKTQ